MHKPLPRVAVPAVLVTNFETKCIFVMAHQLFSVEL